MPRRAGWLLLASGLAGSAAVLAKRAAPSRESLVPLLRAGQEHGRQAERLLAAGLPLGADEERLLGLEMERGMPANGPRQPLVESLGRRLERTGLAPRFAGRVVYRTVPGTEANALAAPGGVVVLSEGLIDRVQGDPDRVAFVIGHELGHAELGHTADLVRYRGWLSRWGIPGADLAQALRELAALSFSEGQELEADRFSLELLRRADFRPEASIEAMVRIDDRRPSDEAGPHRDPATVLAEAVSDYFHTHPGRKERLDRLRSALGPRSERPETAGPVLVSPPRPPDGPNSRRAQ